MQQQPTETWPPLLQQRKQPRNQNPRSFINYFFLSTLNGHYFSSYYLLLCTIDDKRSFLLFIVRYDDERQNISFWLSWYLWSIWFWFVIWFECPSPFYIIPTPKISQFPQIYHRMGNVKNSLFNILLKLPAHRICFYSRDDDIDWLMPMMIELKNIRCSIGTSQSIWSNNV